MRLALVTEAYPPQRSSGAVQMRDLAREFARQGHQPVVLMPMPGQAESWTSASDEGVEIYRLRAPEMKDISYTRRTVNEFLMPFAMRRALRGSPVDLAGFDGVVCYSPSIFHGPLVRSLKTASGCPAYLILRDIFPQWMLDLGLIRRNWRFRVLQAVADYEYSQCDVIGIQTPGNAEFVAAHARRARVEVLPNWLAPPILRPCSIDLSVGPLAGRKVFVYAGNMGIAQGMDKMLDLARELDRRSDIGFLFVGRGSEAARMAVAVENEGLANVVMHDEIDPDEIPGVFAQAHAGLLTLAHDHRTHNIPGKFISYMHCGLPVLASVNPANDIVSMIRDHAVGAVSVDPTGADLATLAVRLVDEADDRHAMTDRARALAQDQFSAAAAVRQVVAALSAETR
ncbi:glycosyltransferase family 4 protein [Tsuneonella sp. HG094]